VVDTAGDEFVQRLFRQGLAGQRAGDFGDAFRVDRSTPAPFEGLPVGVDGGAVEDDGAVEGGGGYGHQAELPGVAEEQHVAVEGVAHQAAGEVLGVDELDVIGAEGVAQLGFEAGQREVPVAVAREVGGGGVGAADDGARAAFEHFRQGFGAGADDEIAAEYGVGFAGGDAGGVNVFGAVGDAQVGEDGAVFLRQAGHVER